MGKTKTDWNLKHYVHFCIKIKGIRDAKKPQTLNIYLLLFYQKIILDLI